MVPTAELDLRPGASAAGSNGTPPFRVREATDGDGEALLGLLSAPAARGGVRWAIERTVDFFAPFRAEEGPWRVLVAEEASTGRLVGCMTIVARPTYVHGRERVSCYISNFTVRKEARGRGVGDALCWRASEFCSSVAGADGPVLMAIRRGNPHMRRLIGGPRGLPSFRCFARFNVHSILTARVRAVAGSGGRFRVRAADVSDLEEMAELAVRELPRRQFAPVVDAARLARWMNDAHALASADHLVAREDGAVVGWLGLWDEASVRRARVVAYTPLAAFSAAARNGLRFITGAPRAPRVGEVVGRAHAVRVCVPAARADVIRALLIHASGELARAGCRWLKIALDDSDPLAAAVSRMTARKVAFDALVVTPAGAYAGPALDDRPLSFEAAQM